ncbi:glucan biosynthesis protein [Ideonella sp. B508-1]|uniref:glucan biosynthesis protein n=1 Tax=Ideonella sp. B508-1 TaxID=137716 RepID=UPI001F48AF26|nr:glucan biosynthesis protein G [Ideonella sp. B508-1]
MTAPVRRFFTARRPACRMLALAVLLAAQAGARAAAPELPQAPLQVAAASSASAAASATAPAASSAASIVAPFFDRLGERARSLAGQPYAPVPSRTPQALKDLSYDQARDIRFRPDHAVWRSLGLPFELMFFHLGKYQTEPVRMHELSPDGERALPYRPEDFDYGANTALQPATWGDIGHAGFRVHYPLNGSAYKDELIVFQGASYFRALGAGQHYGLSARGLAVDSAGGSGPEEFPRFTDFWVVRPEAGAKVLTVFALLDSPRVAGAYRFDIQPGQSTAVNVQARVFLRQTTQPIRTLGIAPLTSMFQFGENQPNKDDFRPEVHDSDGLMVASGTGEWLWRPLQNPRWPLVTSFAMPSLRGFGLMQRDRSFASYEDPEARYEKRPSAWVTPVGDWGAGRVELMQLPTPDETNDNIVAYWVPAQLPAAGQPLNLAWRIDWQGDAQQRPPALWVSQTRAGRGFAPLAAGERQFVIDFNGTVGGKPLPDNAAVQAVVSSNDAGRITEQNVYRVDATGAWRLTLRVQTLDPARPVELRAYLRSGADTVSETWTQILPPQ